MLLSFTSDDYEPILFFQLKIMILLHNSFFNNIAVISLLLGLLMVEYKYMEIIPVASRSQNK